MSVAFSGRFIDLDNALLLHEVSLSDNWVIYYLSEKEWGIAVQKLLKRQICTVSHLQIFNKLDRNELSTLNRGSHILHFIGG